ncbi:MAG: hypothetical protein ACRCV8_02875 [Enterococcus larvae]
MWKIEGENDMSNVEKFITEWMNDYNKGIEKFGAPQISLNIEDFEAENEEIYKKYLSQEFPDTNRQVKIYLGILGRKMRFSYMHAMQQRDWALLNNVIYQNTRFNLIYGATLASGTDHSNALWDLLAAFTCNNFDELSIFFPKNFPSGKGKFYTEICRNFMEIMIYHQDERFIETKVLADKFLAKKKTTWEKESILYLLALLERDATACSEHLEALCKAYQRLSEVSAPFKSFPLQVHGWYRFAYYVDPSFFIQIKQPKHWSFFSDFERWHKESSYPKGQLFYQYPEKMDLMNRILQAELPTIQLYENGNGRHTDFVKDTDRFLSELTLGIMNSSQS